MGKRKDLTKSNGLTASSSTSPNSTKKKSNGVSPKATETTAEFRQLVVHEQVRSLRRRLWQAFQKEDSQMAMRAYKATARDLQAWIQEEIQDAREREQRRLQDEKAKKEAHRPSMMQKLNLGTLMHTSTTSKEQQPVHASNDKQQQNRMSLRRRGSSQNVTAKDSKTSTPSALSNTDQTPLERDLIMADTTNNDNALLPLHMNPSEPFMLDDYKDPTYEINPTTGEACSVASMNEPENSLSPARAAQIQSTSHRHFKAFAKKRNRQVAQPRTPTTATTSFWNTLKILENRRGRGAMAWSEDPSDMLEPSEHTANPESAASNDIHTLALSHPKMTTPLHEAARLGDAELVRLMLAHPFVEPNFKNGQRRTALHMVAGGWTQTEERLWRMLQHKIKTKLEHKKKQQKAASLKSVTSNSSDGVGISAPEPIEIERDDEAQMGEGNTTMAGAKKAARALSRLFHTTFTSPAKNRDGNEGESAKTIPTSGSPGGLVWDKYLWNQLKTNRMDCLLAILSWSHPEDGTTSAGEGASVNAVDVQGRTALHYAAELGREDVCMAVLSSFGAMLTVVDHSARTPCELAAEQNHPALAAQLEARALLYSDPYGMDDELLAAVMAEQQSPPEDDLDVSEGENMALVKARFSLVAPFSWFRTLSMNDVDKERAKRLVAFYKGMVSFLQAKEEELELKKVMYGMKVVDVDDFVTRSPDVGNTHGVMQIGNEDLASGSCDCENSLDNKATASESEWKSTGTDGGHAGRTFSVDPPGKAPNDEMPEQSIKSPGNGKMKDDLPGKAGAQQDQTSSEVSSLGETIDKDEESLVEEDLASLRSIQTAYIEQFLSSHGWVVDRALGAFTKAPKRALEAAGVPLQAVVRAHERSMSKPSGTNEDSLSSTVCLICFDEFDAFHDNWTNLANCAHSFCNSCLGDYLADCARSRSTGLSVPCPHHECFVPMSLHELKKLAPNEEIFSMLKKTTHDNFISSAKDLRFCSHPGCDGIVKVSINREMKKWGIDYEQMNCVGAVCTAVCSKGSLTDKSGSITVTYEGVIDPQVTNSRSLTSPISAHRFCFGCGEGKFHFPVTCEDLEKWKQKMSDEVEQLGEDGEPPKGDENYGDIAQRLWMRANTRPCPKCKAPIEKNEGCNHMTCFNPQCKHEFCWICRKDWKLHNTATGGFFRCNRWQDEENHDFYDAPPTPGQTPPVNVAPEVTNDDIMNNPEVMAQTYGTSMHETRIAWKKSKEMKRFLHHYTRWNAHMESAALEKMMSETVCERMAPVVNAAADYTCDANFNFNGKGLSFIHAAFKELLECRSVLQHSYAYSFFKFESLAMKRARHGKRLWNEKSVFEQLQSELETITEQMSDIVARAHLRATQTQILFLTVGASARRNEFATLIFTLMKNRHQAGGSERKRVPVAPPRSVPGATASLVQSNPTPGSLVVQGVASGRQGGTDDGQDIDLAALAPAQDAVREALLASLEAFMANTAQPSSEVQIDVADLDDDFDDDDDEMQFRSWACSACTYMNTSGRRCAICGTQLERFH